ncbi:MAG: glycosyltransferase [Planctomycetes bacterium]|nr:glycosyltransferase [Planctomycetota bacterium]
MQTALRIALVLDPINLRTKAGGHAPMLARELLGRGHHVRGFGVPAGAIPHSASDAGPGEGGLRSFNADAVIAYGALSPSALRGARAADKQGAPLLLVESAMRPRMGLTAELLGSVGKMFWGGYVRKRAARVIALDPVASQRVIEMGFSPELLRVLPQGVDVSQFRPGLLSSWLQTHRVYGRILLYAGRLDEGRGVEVLVEAFARTVGQRLDWNLILAGEGPLEHALRAQVDRLGVASRVHFFPRPQAAELPGLMGGCTLLAVPATTDDVLGRQIPRAMACGLPVLASDRPRLTALFQDEECGLLVRSGDVSAWEVALLKAAGSPAKRMRWGARARDVAVSILSWDRIAEGVEEELLSLRERAE